jgi:y4mF family transcriptional regulator
VQAEQVANAHYGAQKECATMTNREIGEKVRARRKMLRLRQRDSAEHAGVTLRGLTDLENGKANPTINQLAKVAEVLGLELRLTERSVHA